jgi:hypothetical protein
MTNDPRACAIGGRLQRLPRPHDLVGQYATKARNGFWHSFYFTTGGFHEPIRIQARDRAITEGGCRHCHADGVQAIDGGGHASGACRFEIDAVA